MPLENASSRYRVLHEGILVHPDKMKDIVLACVVLHNMFRAERGTRGRERDLEDEEIPCEFEDADPGDEMKLMK